MKRYRAIWLGLVLIGLLGGVGWYGVKPKEPMCRGKTVSEWFDAISNGSTTPGTVSVYHSDPAILALKEMGADAVPYLMEQFRLSNSAAHNFLVDAPKRWFHLNARSDFERHVMAAVTLQQMGPDAESAVPELIEMATRSPEAIEAVEILGYIHARPQITIPFLEQLVKSAVPAIQYRAILALGGFGPQARHAVPGLISLWQATSDTILKRWIAESLGKIDPEAAARAGVK